MESKKYEEEKTLSIAEIDQHIESESEKVKGLKIDICGAFKVARPILIFARTIAKLIKPNWVPVIESLISAGDAACPA